MYTLFLDTHGELITVALYNNKNLFIKEKESHYSHAVYFVPMIKEILEENNLTLKDIKNIVCINGPGSFTGLRIGLSVAKTLAYTLNVPIHLISTLEAYLVSSPANSKKLAVIEDNKGYYIMADDIKEEYVLDLSNYGDYTKVEEKLNVPEVIKKALEKPSTNAHLVRANYVKQIEVDKCK